MVPDMQFGFESDVVYEMAYSDLGQQMLNAIGQEIYGEYIGQLSWMTTEEYRKFIARLGPTADSHVLEIGCGNGAAAVYLATSTGARVTGLDRCESGLRFARELAKNKGLDGRAEFRAGDASRVFPFADASFDAIFANDTFSLIPDRTALLRECHRVLRPGGRLLFTDPMVLCGIVTSEEIETRTWAGASCVTPRGENETLLERIGFTLASREDLTESVVVVARRQAGVFERYRQEIIAGMGQEIFDGLARSTAMAERLADQKKLIRIAYLAEKAA